MFGIDAYTLSCHSDTNPSGVHCTPEGFQRVEKPFSARWQTVKKVPEAEQLAPVGVQRYGRARVATEVKILA